MRVGVGDIKIIDFAAPSTEGYNKLLVGARGGIYCAADLCAIAGCTLSKHPRMMGAICVRDFSPQSTAADGGVSFMAS